jgi:SAM-dependent methyltransferase
VADRLAHSWSAFTHDIAVRYMKGYGHPAPGSKTLLGEIVGQMAHGRKLSILELGCGNGAIYEHFRAIGIDFDYVGVDFSEVLLDVARTNHMADPSANFILDDVTTLEAVDGSFDVGIYSHVLEALASPENSLQRARALADRIIIRFFEPPEHDVDWVELKELEVGDGRTMPYIRRRMSRDYYRLILTKLGCHHVDVYHDPGGSRDQVHVLYFG